MQKYLEYVKYCITTNDVLTDAMKFDCIARLNKDIAFCSQCKDNSPDDNIDKQPNEIINWDTHHFHFFTGETIKLSWDIDRVYKKTVLINPTKSSVSEFETLLSHDLNFSEAEFNKVSLEVKSIQKHKYGPVLICHMVPFNSYILLDGRHRYIERKKFDSQIDYIVLQSDQIIDCLFSSYEMALYALIHNISIINDAFMGDFHFYDFLNLI